MLLLAALLPASCQAPAETSGLTGQKLSAKASVPFDALRPALEAPRNPEGVAGATTAPTPSKAEALMGQKAYRKALAELDKARRSGEESATLDRPPGLCQRALGEHDDARASLAKADKAGPDNIQLQMTLGRYAVRAGKASEAIRRFRLALLCSDATEDNPDTAEATLRLAALLEQQGYLAAAVTCYLRLGELVVGNGRAYRGRPVLRNIVDQPERCELAAGKVLVKLGRDAQAAEVLERVYRYNKTHPQAGVLAVEAMVAAGKHDRAGEIVMEMAREKALQPMAARAAMTLCRARKDPAVPLKMLEDFLRVRGTNPLFAVTLATIATEYGAVAEATRLLERYRSGDGDDRAIAFRLAGLYGRTGHPVKAARELARVIGHDSVGVEPVRDSIAEMTGPNGPITGESIRPVVSAAAEAEGDLTPGMLCVAGMIAEGVGEADRARGLYARAVKEFPGFLPSYEALYDLNVADKKDAAAEAVLKQLPEADENAYFRHYLTGKDHLRAGRSKEAVAELEAARRERARHVPTLMRLGQAHVRQLNADKAAECLLSAYALAPNLLPAARELYGLYRLLGRRNEAANVIERFVRDNPGHRAGQLLQARHHVRTHRSDRAHELLGKMLEDDPRNVEATLLRVQLESPELMSDVPVPADHAAKMIRRLRKVLARDPDNDPAGRLYAAMLANQDRQADAARVLLKLHARKPEDSTLTTALLAALAEADKTDKAIAVVDALVARPALDGRIEEVLIESLLTMEQYDKAVAVAESFLGREGDARRTIVRRLRALRAYEKAKRLARADQRLDEWIPDTEREHVSSLRLTKIRFLALAGQGDQAVTYAREWLAEKGTDEKALQLEVIGLLLAGEAPRHALTLLEEFIKVGDDGALAGHRLLCLAKLKRFDDLRSTATQWIAQDPDDDKPRVVAVSVLAAHERYDDALKIASARLSQLARSDPAGEGWDKQIHQGRALVIDVLIQAKRKDQAIARAREFVQASPKDPRARTLLATVLAKAERNEEYLRELAEAHKLDPDETGINNDLGYSWVDRGLHLDKAEAMIRKAVKDKPGVAAFQDSLAWALYKTARFTEAKSIFDTIVDAGSEKLHPVILDHAGDTCWRLGMKLEAIRMWARALAMATRGEDDEKDRETRSILKNVPAKIAACRRGLSPRLAPLAAGYGAPAGLDD